jgi:hypothetical protein
MIFFFVRKKIIINQSIIKLIVAAERFEAVGVHVG